MDSNSSLLKDRFHKWSSLIEPLYQKNISFNSLCDDYLLVVEQIRRHSSSEAPLSSADLAELKKLLSELEQEMIIYFEEARKARNL